MYNQERCCNAFPLGLGVIDIRLLHLEKVVRLKGAMCAMHTRQILGSIDLCGAGYLPFY